MNGIPHPPHYIMGSESDHKDTGYESIHEMIRMSAIRLSLSAECLLEVHRKIEFQGLGPVLFGSTFALISIR